MIRIARGATFVVDVVGGVLGEVLGRCRDKHALFSGSLVTDKREEVWFLDFPVCEVNDDDC